MYMLPVFATIFSPAVICLLVVLSLEYLAIIVMGVMLCVNKTKVNPRVKSEPAVKNKPTREKKQPVKKEEKAYVPVVIPELDDEPEDESEEEQVLEEAVTVEKAEELISDDTAIAAVAFIGEERKGKMDVVNIDTLNDNFRGGSKITIEKLRAKGLLDSNVCRVKVLARGELKKRFTVIADDFSMQAIKMIQLAGGKVVLYSEQHSEH